MKLIQVSLHERFCIMHGLATATDGDVICVKQHLYAGELWDIH
jgi:hypothetical protein